MAQKVVNSSDGFARRHIRPGSITIRWPTNSMTLDGWTVGRSEQRSENDSNRPSDGMRKRFCFSFFQIHTRIIYEIRMAIVVARIVEHEERGYSPCRHLLRYHTVGSLQKTSEGKREQRIASVKKLRLVWCRTIRRRSTRVGHLRYILCQNCIDCLPVDGETCRAEVFDDENRRKKT